jgi:hypothetical protein
MAVDLMTYVDSLKREIQPPGTDLFATVTNEQWVGYLADAFWEARLDGFLAGYTTDQGATAGDVTIVSTTGGPDLDQRWMALVILYAGVKILRNRILNMSTTFRAKAGPVEFEQQNSATMLAEMLKQLKATKDRIVEEVDEAGGSLVMVLDAYSTRLYSGLSYFGGPELMA